MCHAICLSEMSEPATVGSSRGVKFIFNEAMMDIRFPFLEMYVMCIALRMQDRLLSGTGVALQKEQ